jgi:hypothetical protein
MKIFLTKLILGRPVENKVTLSPLGKVLKNIKVIWNNVHHDDLGIEKLVRLSLAISQLFFPGTYIKQYFGRYNVSHRELSMDVFILLKILFPLIIIKFHLANNWFFFGILIWFMLETISYISTLIFASDIFPRPRSYRRSMILLFFNYIEIVLDFAVIYSSGNYLNHPFHHWFDSIYFSFITSASIGFGDFHPITPFGKLLVSIQSLLFLVFVVMFINFFSGKVENKGYFGNKN